MLTWMMVAATLWVLWGTVPGDEGLSGPDDWKEISVALASQGQCEQMLVKERAADPKLEETITEEGKAPVERTKDRRFQCLPSGKEPPPD